jgi:polygalacturonase
MQMGDAMRTIIMPILVLGLISFSVPLAGQEESKSVDLSAVEQLKPALPKIPERVFNLADYGAVGDGKTMNTDAISKAIMTVEDAGGGKLVVPEGVYLTKPFRLCSNLDMHLEAGAVIKAPESFADLKLPDPSTLKTQAEADAAFRSVKPLIQGKGLHDVAITGTGTIDGSGQHWWDWSEKAARSQPGRIVIRRPNLVAIDGCDRILVSDVTFTNSPKFHLVPKQVNDLTIERVKVRAPASSPNTDAIDPGPGKNFWIHDCDIDTGDDNIVIKTGGSNILIENNTIKHGHGISIGSGTTDGINNMLVRHCTFDGTDNGIRIKSMRGAGGLVEKIRYTDITMKNVKNAIVLQLDYMDNNRPDFTGEAGKIPAIRNILIDHVNIENSHSAGLFHGLPESRITNVKLQDVTITAAKDFDVKDADEPVCERVTKTIKSGGAPAKTSAEQ